MAYDLILRKETPANYSRDSGSPVEAQSAFLHLLIAVAAVAGTDYIHRRKFNRESAVVRRSVDDGDLNLTQRLRAISD